MVNSVTSSWKGMAMWRWFLLLLVAWPGPRPIVHSHQQLVQRSTSNSMALGVLGTHLAVFHSPESSPLPPWQVHWHWSYGDCSLTNEQATVGEASPSAANDAIVPCCASELALESWCDHIELVRSKPEWLTIEHRTSTPTGRLWLQLCGAWTC